MDSKRILRELKNLTTSRSKETKYVEFLFLINNNNDNYLSNNSNNS